MQKSSSKSIAKQLQDVICYAIKERRLFWFYYESDSGAAWRKVEPYLLGIKEKGKGNPYFSGLPDTEFSKPFSERSQGHYLLSKIDLEKFEVLNETYKEPKVPRDQITDTPNVKVICRYFYPDEIKSSNKKYCC